MNAGIVKALLVAQVGWEALLLSEGGLLRTYKVGRVWVQPQPLMLAESVRWLADLHESECVAATSGIEYGPKYVDWLRWLAQAVEYATKR